jgi:hypothetical protein
VELRAWHRSLVDGELLAQGEVLEGELAVAADEEGEEPEQLEQESDHRAAIVAGEDRQINHLTGGRHFGEGQCSRAPISSGPARRRALSSAEWARDYGVRDAAQLTPKSQSMPKSKTSTMFG